MAQYIPKDWKASKAASTEFTKKYTDIYKMVSLRARKYFNLGSHKSNDLIQEGMIAALYALDSFSPEKGSLKGYMGTLVENALAMIACEARTQSRQPYSWTRVDDDKVAITEGEKWVRAPLMDFSDPDDIQTESHNPEKNALDREAELEKLGSRVRVQNRLNAIRADLSPEAAKLFSLRVSPPIELLVLARNLIGRSISAQARIPDEAFRKYMGLEPKVFRPVLRDVRNALEENKLKLPA